jgi:glutamate synthase (ferredoxin)
VLDADGRFAERCNHELVALEELEQEDVQIVRALVTEHLERTESPVAARVLAEWPAFVKVMPHEYRRAHEDGAVSSGGEGFLIRETEEEVAA